MQAPMEASQMRISWVKLYPSWVSLDSSRIVSQPMGSEANTEGSGSRAQGMRQESSPEHPLP